MKYIQLIIVCLLITHYSSGQAKGFLGKENFFAISIPVHIEASRALSYSYIYDKSQESIRRPISFSFSRLFTLGLNAEYYRVLSKRAGVGAEFNYFRRNLFYKSNTFFGNSLDYTFTTPRANVYTYRTFFTYSSSTSFLPIGARHKLSIGYQNFVLNPNSVYIQYNNHSGLGNEVVQIENVPDGLKNNFNVIEFSYGATFSYPMSESLFLDLGFDFRFHWFLIDEERLNQQNIANKEIIDNANDLQHPHALRTLYNSESTEIRKSIIHLYDMLSFKVGISYAF